MLFWLAVIIAVAIAALLAYAATKPDVFRIERSLLIQAPADAIFPHIADFHAWSGWSPWEALDPDMKRSFSGAEHGVGAVYAWEGNKKVGSGRMQITRAVPFSALSLDLSFAAPMKAENKTDFTLAPEGGGPG